MPRRFCLRCNAPQICFHIIAHESPRWPTWMSFDCFLQHNFPWRNPSDSTPRSCFGVETKFKDMSMLNLSNQAAVEALCSGTYLENYLDTIESLPDDLQRNVTLLRELDIQSRGRFTPVSCARRNTGREQCHEMMNVPFIVKLDLEVCPNHLCIVLALFSDVHVYFRRSEIDHGLWLRLDFLFLMYTIELLWSDLNHIESLKSVPIAVQFWKLTVGFQGYAIILAYYPHQAVCWWSCHILLHKYLRPVFSESTSPLTVLVDAIRNELQVKGSTIKWLWRLQAS